VLFLALIIAKHAESAGALNEWAKSCSHAAVAGYADGYRASDA